MTIPEGPRLNIGSGPVVAAGWVSVDGSLQARLAGRPWLTRVGRRVLGIEIGHWPRGIEYRDLRRGIGYADRAVAAVYASHVLEHLHRGDALRLLADIRRALKPGGVCRVVVPDVHAIVGWYLAHRQEPAETRKTPSSDLLMDLLMLRAREPRNGGRLVGAVRRAADLHEHKWMYDAEGLVALFGEAGFAGAAARGFLDSRIPRDLLQQVERADRVCDGAGVCVEATA